MTLELNAVLSYEFVVCVTRGKSHQLKISKQTKGGSSYDLVDYELRSGGKIR
jgi:hypothetical protein